MRVSVLTCGDCATRSEYISSCGVSRTADSFAAKSAERIRLNHILHIHAYTHTQTHNHRCATSRRRRVSCAVFVSVSVGSMYGRLHAGDDSKRTSARFSFCPQPSSMGADGKTFRRAAKSNAASVRTSMSYINWPAFATKTTTSTL